mmetsp:Transcript_20833/g.50548  ORF Transcript_20833/g.50548 Transcript_20833/m.50548 type:complete len:253 (-) Transcript_20833:710-1468(-)
MPMVLEACQVGLLQLVWGVPQDRKVLAIRQPHVDQPLRVGALAPHAKVPIHLHGLVADVGVTVLLYEGVALAKPALREPHPKREDAVEGGVVEPRLHQRHEWVHRAGEVRPRVVVDHVVALVHGREGLVDDVGLPQPQAPPPFLCQYLAVFCLEWTIHERLVHRQAGVRGPLACRRLARTLLGLDPVLGSVRNHRLFCLDNALQCLQGHPHDNLPCGGVLASRGVEKPLQLVQLRLCPALARHARGGVLHPR